ncbi:MAG: fibro-slime domain-containing protein [Lachnospiraceae bacterium]|nr:fibro-slime domain-containing protein [Lachnospiraceae bacterium]
MPFNDIADNKLSANVNFYDEFGNALFDHDPGYGKPLFLTQDTNNFLFGMKLQANFTQPKDGMRGEGRTPMRFEVNGDDNMWVFIDGMLVLDIGGIHDAHTGYIDFSTGEVAVNVSGTEYSTPTTIKAQMLEADKSLPDSYFRGNTLSNYSLHSIQVFYMERGAGASNCKFKFNLPVVPRSNVNIQKEVISDDPAALADDYHFQLYVEDGDEEETYRLASNYTCTVYPAGEGTEELQQVGTDGILTLNNGEWAAIKEAGVDGLSYYVKEVGVNPDSFNEYRVNGELITAENCVLQDGTMQITGPTKILGSDYSCTMKFQNIKNKSKIKIIKTIDRLYDINGDAIFTFAVQNVSTGEIGEQ